MSTSKELYERAAMATAKARAINDEYRSKASMPAEAARQMGQWLNEADSYRRDADLKAREEYLAEPQYKHDMTGGGFADYIESATSAPYRSPSPGEMGKWFADVALGRKSALVEDSTSGGVNLVPADYAGTILKELPRLGVIRNLATIVPTTSNKVSLGNIALGSFGWGPLELANSTTTDGLASTPAGTNDDVYVEDATALVKIGVNELEDGVAIESVIRQGLSAQIAETEDDAFAFGSGHTNKQPSGIAYGSTVTQGTTATTNATVTPDDVSGLVYKVPSWAQANGVYLAHSSVTQAAMLLKDSNGAYLWEPRTAAGQPATWRGYPWYTVDGLPAMTASTGAINTSLVFGDVRQGYLIADRNQLRVQVLRERYADEGKIGLLFTHRVGGGTVRPKAFARHLL